MAVALSGTAVWLAAASALDERMHAGWILGIPALATMAVCAWAAGALVTRARWTLLTPLPLFLAVCAMIFGLGPLFYAFQSDSPYGNARGRIPIDGTDVLRVEALNVVGLLAVALGLCAASAVWLRWHRSHPQSPGTHPAAGASRGAFALPTADTHLLRACIAFTFLALLSRGLKRVVGIDPLEVMPGFLSFTEYLGSLAVLVGAIYAARRGGAAWAFVAVPLAVEVTDGFLALRKSKIVIPILWAFLGAYLGGKSRRVLMVGVGLSLATFAAIYPLTNLGRRVVWSDRGVSAVQFYASMLDADRETTEGIDMWLAWSRWNYTPNQRVVMREYEQGRPGQTFAQLPWLLVPRFLVPSKPVLDFGPQVSRLVEGLGGHSISPTAFGEAYWNGGWLLVGICGFLMGGALVLVALVCLWLFSQASLASWLVGFVGILVGQLPMNFFSVAFVGSLVIFLILSLLVCMTLPLTTRLLERRHA
jgi:hypothetical protein